LHSNVETQKLLEENFAKVFQFNEKEEMLGLAEKRFLRRLLRIHETRLLV